MSWFSSPRLRRKKDAFAPRLETLEDRTTPVVSVVQAGNILTITGDAGNNLVQIVDNGTGTAFGNSGVGIVFGPGQNNSDFAVLKRTPVKLLGEGGNIEFRTEFFNVFNHTQFANPSTSVNSLATFGVISNTSVNPRIMQFALKLNF